MRRLAFVPLFLAPLGCDLIQQATATIVVGGIVAGSPELKYAGFYDVPSEVTASVWLGERASATSQEAPVAVSNANVTITIGARQVSLPETSERGVYATTSVESANLVYEAGATYVFEAVITETHGGETVAPTRLTADDLSLTPAPGTNAAFPGLGTHAKGAALTVGWPTSAGKYGVVTVLRADPAQPSRPELVFDNRPQTAQEILDLVLGTPPTTIEIPAGTFARDGLYAVILVAAERGDLLDNTSIASPLLVGSGAAALLVVGTP